MTIKERVAAREAATRDATTISNIIERIGNAGCVTQHNRANRNIGSKAFISVEFGGSVNSSFGGFSSDEVAASLLPLFRDFSLAVDVVIKGLAADLIAALEARADALLSPPTVTVVSNGVNVEVK